MTDAINALIMVVSIMILIVTALIIPFAIAYHIFCFVRWCWRLGRRITDAD